MLSYRMLSYRCKHLARHRVPLQLLFLLLLLLLLQSVEAVADRVGGASLEHLPDPRRGV